MATEADKAIQQADGPNGVAAGAPNGLGDKTLAENTTAEKAVAEPSPVEVPVPAPATAEALAPPVPAPAEEELKQSETVPPAPVEAAPAPVAEESKVSDDVPKPVEQAAPVQAETSAEAPLVSVPIEASSDPAPTEEKLLEKPAAPIVLAEVVSDAPKPNGTTNGTISTSKEQEDTEMKDAPAASPAADWAAAPAPAPAEPKSDSAAVNQPAKEPEVAAVSGEKRKAADDEPAVEEVSTDNKKAKIEEATAPAEVTTATADPVTAPTTEAVNTEAPLDGAPAPKKAGRPKKTQKEKVPVSPAGRTLRKTRSQGPVEV